MFRFIHGYNILIEEPIRSYRKLRVLLPEQLPANTKIEDITDLVPGPPNDHRVILSYREAEIHKVFVIRGLREWGGVESLCEAKNLVNKWIAEQRSITLEFRSMPTWLNDNDRALIGG